MKNKNFKISGLSILEALVSTAIVGIGFIAILQMTNFSVQSIDRSADRTKANYLTEMIAEDVLGSKNSLYGIASDSEDIQIKGDGTITLSGGGDASNIQKFSQHLAQNTWNAGLNCAGTTNTATGGPQFQENIYETQEVDAPRNKEAKWDAIFGENRFLKCTNATEEKKIQVFKVCRWDECDYKLDAITDDPMYIGRVEMKLNDGKKRKFLYFQTDYKLRR